MEIVIPIDDEPWERILDVEGVAHEGSSPNMNYGGLPSPGEPPHFEVTNVEWHEYDPLDGEGSTDRSRSELSSQPREGDLTGDPVEFYVRHEEEVHDQALENKQKRYDDRWAYHPDV